MYHVDIFVWAEFIPVTSAFLPSARHRWWNHWTERWTVWKRRNQGYSILYNRIVYVYIYKKNSETSLAGSSAGCQNGQITKPDIVYD